MNHEEEKDLILLGLLNAERVKSVDSLFPNEAEFRVFSQFGEDGLIQYLIHKCCCWNQTFIEIGIENYLESNTRFLLTGGEWSGLVIDASANHINTLRSYPWFWRYNLDTKVEFITAENINRTIVEYYKGNIGLLSLDIDGNDYWVWKALDIIKPDIVVCEYNALLGYERPLVIPYDPTFNIQKAHPSELYFGASLEALRLLGKEKGYILIACNNAGTNAFFVHESVGGDLLTDRSKRFMRPCAYTQCSFRLTDTVVKRCNLKSNVRDPNIIKGMPFLNVVTGEIEPF